MQSAPLALCFLYRCCSTGHLLFETAPFCIALPTALTAFSRIAACYFCSRPSQVMVGELVGARLIAHAGSLMSLAKHPASTVQILGAEKVRSLCLCSPAACPPARCPRLPHLARPTQALFRALKTKHDTPKYGLIYHASLVGQAAPKNKGKVRALLASRLACHATLWAMRNHLCAFHRDANF
jgi:hypothetical protein